MGNGVRVREATTKKPFLPRRLRCLLFIVSHRHRGEAGLAEGRYAPGHVGELTQIVPFEMVDAALAEARTRQRRLRDLPSRVVVYLLLAGCLFPEIGYRGVWRKLTAGLDPAVG